VAICADAYDATKDADVLTVLTEWDDFRWLDPKLVAANMPGRTVVDARNLLERAAWNHAGFRHLGIGR
jgi:UDPglucose 6-dehydrogenase